MYVIGTAGHVDHGKSALVKALTGIDPDRLQEEQEREMTIDLGFAWLTLPSGRQVSVVDVPGHERFVKNMLAGVGGIDLAVLVVAADESVMPQTREHLAILDLLDVRHGLVALTKVDLVDAEWLDLVEQEVEEALQGSSLEGAPLARVSSVRGDGLEEMKGLLDRLLEDTPPRQDLGRPRLAVDRSFTMSGFGTVVTGTLVDGSLAVGQEVELVPSGIRGRIRGLQSHRQRLESAGPGRRVAVNLAGVERDAVQRGEVLTTRGWLQPTRMADVRLRAARWAPHPIRHNLGVTLYAGTAEASARVRLLDAAELAPGQEGWAQVHLAAPVALVAGDRFVVRSAQWTLGGGQVVDPSPRRHRRHQAPVLARMEAMARGSPAQRLLQALEGAGPLDVPALASRAGLTVEEAAAEMAASAGRGEAMAVGGPGATGGLYLSRSDWEGLKVRASSALEEYHRRNPLRSGLPREELRSRLGVAPALFDRVLAMLAQEGVAEEEGALARAPGHRVRLTPEQEREAGSYIRALEAQPFSPPTDRPLDPALLASLAEQGRVARASDSVVFAASAYAVMVQRVVERLRERGSITVGDVRDMFGTSRKYALALLEQLDQRRVTRRVGDERVLLRAPEGPAAPGPAQHGEG